MRPAEGCPAGAARVRAGGPRRTGASDDEGWPDRRDRGSLALRVRLCGGAGRTRSVSSCPGHHRAPGSPPPFRHPAPRRPPAVRATRRRAAARRPPPARAAYPRGDGNSRAPGSHSLSDLGFAARRVRGHAADSSTRGSTMGGGEGPQPVGRVTRTSSMPTSTVDAAPPSAASNRIRTVWPAHASIATDAERHLPATSVAAPRRSQTTVLRPVVRLDDRPQVVGACSTFAPWANSQRNVRRWPAPAGSVIGGRADGRPPVEVVRGRPGSGRQPADQRRRGRTASASAGPSRR